ncbi:putative RING-H2 finger protein ATL21A [Humulus lupulus]|uniref:putative RING-H2 finger protein ATL21A n=1 Tax=Humulus lupulus TaxID=3486 RepID=UPI002B4170CE|nr:putative RING-H2 finger protein ATL21A [Humulus lupulus]
MASYIFYSLLILSTVLPKERSASQDNDGCTEARCGENEPPIRFPFRLEGRQPPHCGFPGFDLSCTNSSQTMLELPNLRLKLLVTEINYQSQSLCTYNINPYSINKENLKFLNRLVSPFQFYYESSMLLKCSFNDTDNWMLGPPIPFLSDSGYFVYAVSIEYYTNFEYWDSIVLCSRMFNLPVPSAIFQPRETVDLSWSEPDCEYCEAEGKKCKLTTRLPYWNNETECFDETRKGGHRFKFPSVTAVILILW